MKYWNDEEAMQWLMAFAGAFNVFFLTMFFISFRIDVALKASGLTIQELYGCCVERDWSSDLLLYIMLFLWISSTILYTFGLFKRRTQSAALN